MKTACFEGVTYQIQNAFMHLFSQYQVHEITVKRLCEKTGIARTSFYNYYSDIYSVLENIEDTLILDLKELNQDSYIQNFKDTDKYNFTYFYKTLDYIKERDFWFRTLLNKSRDGQFIYKWKKIIKEDFAQKYRYEKVNLENEVLVLEMISSGCIGAYTYWVNNLDKISKKTVAREVLYRLNRDFFKLS